MGKPKRSRASSSAAVYLAGAGCFSALWPNVARAEEEPWVGAYVNPGAVWSWTNDPVGSSGISFEVSGGYNFQFVDEWYAPHVGALFRYGEVDDGLHEGAQRGAVSAQGGVGPLGVEVGFGWRGAMEDVAPQRNGVLLSPFASAGFLYIGPEWFFPVGATLGEPPELTLNFGLKIPTVQIVWAIQGLGSMWSRMPSGRPLRIDGVVRVAELLPTASRCWSAASLPDIDSLTPAERRRLGAFWLAEARAEHASVPAFAHLSLTLTGLGAPPELLAACHRAALDEIEHAKACFALAGAYLGETFSPGPIDMSGIRVTRSLAEVAIASLVEGWFGEGAAAAIARAALRNSRDPAVRAALSRIARQERRHAELGRRIVLFALAHADADLVAMLDSSVASLIEATGRTASGDLTSLGERAHGLLSSGERTRVAVRTCRKTARQWFALRRSACESCSRPTLSQWGSLCMTISSSASSSEDARHSSDWDRRWTRQTLTGWYCHAAVCSAQG